MSLICSSSTECQPNFACSPVNSTNGVCVCDNKWLGPDCSVAVTQAVTVLSTITWSWAVQSNTFYARLASQGGNTDNPVNWIGLMFGASDGMTGGSLLVFHTTGTSTVETGEFHSNTFEQPNDSLPDYITDVLSVSTGQNFDVMFSRPCHPPSGSSNGLSLPTTPGTELAISIAFGPQQFPDWGYHGNNRERLIADLLTGQASIDAEPGLTKLYAPVIALVAVLLLGSLIIQIPSSQSSEFLQWRLIQLTRRSNTIIQSPTTSAVSVSDNDTKDNSRQLEEFDSSVLTIAADQGRVYSKLSLLTMALDTMTFNAVSTLLSMSLEQLLVVGLYIGSIIAFVVIGHAEDFAWNIVFGHLTAIHLTVAFYPITRNSIILILFKIPFERALVYHRTLARLTILFAAIHLYYNLMMYDGNILFSQDPLPHGDGAVYGTISLLCILVMSVTAFETVRRSMFELFYWVHIPLALTAAAMAMIHSIYARYYLIAPLVLYFVDRAIRFYRSHRQVEVTSLAIHGTQPHRVVSLSLRAPWLKFHPGQYAFLRFPSLSLLQWHPFSFSCKSGDDTVTFHVLEIGSSGFTHELAQAVHKEIEDIESNSATQSSQFSRIRSVNHAQIALTANIDGPHGKLSLPLASVVYSTVILVAGGIGVTPLISILDWLLSTEIAGIDQIVFIWSARFKTILLDLFPRILERAANSSRCKLLLFHTRDDTIHKDANDIDCSIAPIVRFGRPNLSLIFDQCRKHSHDSSKVAVLTCGPRSLMNEVELCSKSSGFHIHKETFQL